ncbi:MAG TPA: AAA family ATPase [Phycisphaerae bacterium]|nr:AAA family ATPase [Phycisphaerae bacterium]
MPFVEIPIEQDITIVVGANESGKSHLLSAISNVLCGHSIPVDPFSTTKAEGRPYSETDLCHFALPLTKHATLWPQLGLEFSGLNRDEYKSLTDVEAPKSDLSPRVQVFLMPDNDGYATIYHSHGDQPRRLTLSDFEKIRNLFPQVHFINSQLPFADEVHLGDILQGYGESPGETELFYDNHVLQEIARSIVSVQIPPVAGSPAKTFLETVQGWKEKLAEARRLRSQQLQLEVKLFRDVLGIPKDAIKRVYELVDDDKSHAKALVSKWSEELERVLNLSRYWQQDQDFSLRLTYHKQTISFDITDKTQKTYTFKERSSGLRYFLSYYIQAKAIEKASKAASNIVLMDEPDSFLSIAGQRNLMAVFDSLVRGHGSGNFQLVYTTHSPFLIHRNFPKRIRLVRKGDAEEGTQLVDKARERRFDPIRSALGIELSQTLFMGAINIVTEGASDQFFIAESIRFFASETAASDLINLNEVVIVSAESSSGVYKLISSSQWADESIPTAIVLLDFDDGGRTELKRLTGQIRNTPKILDNDTIIFVNKFLDSKQQDCDVTTEDLVPTSLFIHAVRCYIDRWLKDSVEKAEGLNELLTEEAFTKFGHVAAARRVFDRIRGTENQEYDKLGVFEQLFLELESSKSDQKRQRSRIDAESRELLKKRIIALCHALRARIEAGTKAARQHTGVQAIKRLINDFFLQYQDSPPPTLDLELKLKRLAAEAQTFGADDSIILLPVLSMLINEAKAMRQSGRTELSREDWDMWKKKLEAIMHNPLKPNLSQPTMDQSDKSEQAQPIISNQPVITAS